MKYIYFVSYWYVNNGNVGYGNLECKQSRPITMISDLKEVASFKE